MFKMFKKTLASLTALTFLFQSVNVYAAITANTVWELRDTASASGVNGGGFDSSYGGTDYSQQDTAQLSGLDLLSYGAGSTSIGFSAGGGFTSSMVGNVIHIISGTNFTPGWYLLTSFVSQDEMTIDRTATPGGPGSSGSYYLGGAITLTGTLADDFFEVTVPGNIVWAKNGSFTVGESISKTTNLALATAPITLNGYLSTRGDTPMGDNRPTLAFGANSLSLNSYFNIKNIKMTSTNSTAVTGGIASEYFNIKVTNTSSSANRNSISLGTYQLVSNSEAISQNGTAFYLSASTTKLIGSYAHDSAVGIDATGSSNAHIINNISESNRDFQLKLSGSTGANLVIGNTLYGSEAKVSTCAWIQNGAYANKFYNNIIAGCQWGIFQSTEQYKTNSGGYNDFYNNTSSTFNYTLDVTDLTVNPSFTNASQLTGTTATTSGSVLTQSGGDFSSVTDNVDFLRIVSGTGVTTGIYLITSHDATTLTVNNALGTSSGGDVVWVVPVGHDFSIGTNLKAAGSPATYGTETNNYLDIGAVQRVEPTAGGDTAYTGS